jgi:hypothetical protein
MISLPGASVSIHGSRVDREPTEDEAAFESGHITVRLYSSETVTDLDDNTSPGSGWYLISGVGAAAAGSATMRMPKRVLETKNPVLARIPASAVVNIGRPAGSWAYPEGSVLIEWIEGPTPSALP